jgi:hypothetical protein
MVQQQDVLQQIGRQQQAVMQQQQHPGSAGEGYVLTATVVAPCWVLG